MITSWNDKFADLYSRFIGWIGFGSQKTVVPESVLTGKLELFEKQGSLIHNIKSGSLSTLNHEGGILNVVSGHLTSIQLKGILTIKE